MLPDLPNRVEPVTRVRPGKTDSEYAKSAAEFFEIDYDLVLRARRMGRASALEDLAYGHPYKGEMEAESYRIVSCHHVGYDTAKLLEHAFLVGYVHEYYTSTEEIVSDVNGR